MLKRLWDNYGLGIVLGALFLASRVGQALAGRADVCAVVIDE